MSAAKTDGAVPRDKTPSVVSGFDEYQELEKKANWLSNSIDASIENVAQKRLSNQRKATYLKILTLILSGSATILLGLQIAGLEKWFKDIAFVFASLVTLLTAAEPFFNYRAFWIEHERAKYRFHRLKDEFDFYLAGTTTDTLDPLRLEEFHQKYQEIWNELSENWLDQRQSNRYNINQ